MVTEQQVRRLRMLINISKTKAIAATKAGMDEKTARKYLKTGKMPKEMQKPHDWRTREDPFERDWAEIEEMIQTNSNLESKTIFEYLQRKHVEKYTDGQLRTLQRRIKHWRATKGPAKEVFFPQEHRPGELSAFVLTYSNWETGTICFSESFESLSGGYQTALWELGGVAQRHRTDRMSAAVNKDCNPEKFTQRYRALMRHYGVNAERTNSGRGNENGDIEQRHYRFKKAIEQALILRGSNNFNSLQAYAEFLNKIFNQLNAGRYQKLQEELKILNKLPTHKLEAYTPLKLRVSPSSTIHIQNNIYSVHSRLIKEQVQIKIYLDYIEVWYAKKRVEVMPRLRGRQKQHIQYRHIIDWLMRKPGAFENYRYKSEMFPSSYFRIAYDYLKREDCFRANKEYIAILYIAAKEGESITETAIRKLLSEERRISEQSVRQLVISENKQLSKTPDVKIDNISLEQYDQLLNINEEVLIHG